MRVVILGLVFLSGLALAQLGRTPVAQAQPPQFPASSVSGGPLIALSSDKGDGPQQIVLVDGDRRVMSVYHVDRSTGGVTLKSVRNVNWDLLMDEYNAVKPLPREMRAILENN